MALLYTTAAMPQHKPVRSRCRPTLMLLLSLLLCAGRHCFYRCEVEVSTCPALANKADLDIENIIYYCDSRLALTACAGECH